jgi:hypothetical protein
VSFPSEAAGHSFGSPFSSETLLLMVTKCLSFVFGNSPDRISKVAETLMEVDRILVQERYILLPCLAAQSRFGHINPFFANLVFISPLVGSTNWQ